MKKNILLILGIITGITSFAQSKPDLKVYGETGYYFPSAQNSLLRKIHDGYSVGTGVEASIPIYNHFSLISGIGYRYIHNGQTYTLGLSEAYYGYENGDSGSSTVESEYRENSKNYLLVPLKVRYNTNHRIFLETGLKATWLLGYKFSEANTEFNWVFGTGINMGKMELSLQYDQGLTEQSIGKADVGGPWEMENFKNRSLSLRVSCPIWKK